MTVTLSASGDGWTGQISLVSYPNAMASAHIWAQSGVSGAKAIEGLEYLLALIAEGRQTVIRVRPEVHKEQGFEQDCVVWRGFARIHFTLEPRSSIEYIDEIVPLPM